LVGDLRGFERGGHLRPVRLPGGARAVREPWRMACAWLNAAAGEERDPPAPLAKLIERRAWSAVSLLATTGLSSPVTTSVGRLFDAVAALCGVRSTANYEGQAAVELEALADVAEPAAYPLPLDLGEGPVQLDPRETILAIVSDLERGISPARVSARFHNGLAAATAAALVELARASEVELAVVSGGCFANRILLEGVVAGLERAGLRVLVPRRLPAGDGGIAFGQTAVAAARLAAATPTARHPSAMRS
jgi:hydrogenase maturation protein HypF